MALYAFDGTWNEYDRTNDDGDHTITNVQRFHDVYDEKRRHYYQGVGTRFGRIGKAFGGAFGLGAQDRLEKAYTQLAKNFDKGDVDIDLIGFSRGAALAIAFANNIGKHGVPDLKTKKTSRRKMPGGQRWKKVVRYRKYHKDVQIRFVGVWDIVPAFGIPKDFIIPFSEINLGVDLKAPKRVQYLYHAMAMDEIRETFDVHRLNKGREVWFRGVHSDIGGGLVDRGLSDIALKWMFERAVDAGAPVDPSGARLRPRINKKFHAPMDPIKDDPADTRPIKDNDWVHSSVLARTTTIVRVVPPDARVEA